MTNRNIGIIGAGNMAEAFIKGLLPKWCRESIIASDISRLRCRILQKKYRIATSFCNTRLVKQSKTIILAVKPQDINTVLCETVPFLDEKKLLISIAAGITTAHIERRVNKKIAVIRVMPNMPALIGRGVLAFATGIFARNADKKAAVKILSCLGETVEIDEHLMDVVTGISGSGPAYFFFLIEMLIDTALKHGFDKPAAEKLAIQTAAGSVELILKIKQSPDILRKRVTSKGGTTEAAFKVFEKHDFSGIFQQAVEAAIKRSEEISCSY